MKRIGTKIINNEKYAIFNISKENSDYLKEHPDELTQTSEMWKDVTTYFHSILCDYDNNQLLISYIDLQRMYQGMIPEYDFIYQLLKGDI